MRLLAVHAQHFPAKSDNFPDAKVDYALGYWRTTGITSFFLRTRGIGRRGLDWLFLALEARVRLLLPLVPGQHNFVE